MQPFCGKTRNYAHGEIQTEPHKVQERASQSLVFDLAGVLYGLDGSIAAGSRASNFRV